MNADKQIKEILSRYEEDFASSTWVVPGGKARAIFHKTIERIAARAGVKFDPPQILSTEQDNIAMIVTGSLGERVEWSVGEASPKNNKNAYPYSMAEKRGKDRVVLKLVGLHGLLYSEEEADDFKSSAPAPVRAEQAGGDITPRTAPSADVSKSPRIVADALIAALKLSKTEAELNTWATDNKAAIDGLPGDLQDEVRHAFSVHRSSLRYQSERAA